MNLLVQGAGNYPVGDEDIEAREAGQPREQVPVGGHQSVGVERPVGNSQDDVPPGADGGGRQQLAPQSPLVDAGRCRTQLEFAERGDEKPCLPDETFGAAIV